MIHLDLGTAPTVLQNEEARRLPVALAAYSQWKSSGTDDDREAFTRTLTGYRVAIDALHWRQHGKCAWCERQTGKEGSPIDHVRPQREVLIEPPGAKPFRDVEHYWWLCWRWENLLFACSTCNTGNKGVRFPLRDGSAQVPPPPAGSSTPLPPACYDTSVEQRLLIDPRLDDPLKHLDWRPVDPSKPPITWRFQVDQRDDRGEKTIEVLGLHAVEKHINAHFRLALWPDWKRIRKALDDGDMLTARQEWADVCAKLLDDPEQPFRGPAWWALMHLHDRQNLPQYGFAQPARPSVRNGGPP